MSKIFTVMSGIILFIVCLAGACASCAVSIFSELELFTGSEMYAFIAFTIYVQISIFMVSSFETAIKNNFNRHYRQAKLLQYGLLIVIIFLNSQFFFINLGKNGLLIKIITFIMCILVEYGTIVGLKLAVDRIFLNYSFRSDNNDNDKSIVSKLFSNLIFGWKYRIEQKYLENMKLANIDYTKNVQENAQEVKVKEMKEIQQKPDLKLLKFPESLVEQKETAIEEIENIENITNNENENIDNLCSNKDLELIRNTIWSYKDVDIAPSVTALMELAGLKRKVIQSAKKKLEEEGFITTKGKTTFVNTKENKKNVSKIKN